MTTATKTSNAQLAPMFAALRWKGGTWVSAARGLEAPSPRKLFQQHRKAMAAEAVRRAVPGVSVFAAHVRAGLVGQLWLPATDVMHTAVIGRHDVADLALPLDDTLSLRHLFLAARRDGDGVRFLVVDLESENGLSSLTAPRLYAAESTSPVVLTIGDFVLFCLPSGPAAEWVRAPKAWRCVSRAKPLRQVDEACTAPGRLRGAVELSIEGCGASEYVDEDNLRRGYLVGRSKRCDFIADLQCVSRKHVVLVEFDGEPWLFDLGSRNGTTLDGLRIDACRLESGQRYQLGGPVTLRWRGLDDPLGPLGALPC